MSKFTGGPTDIIRALEREANAAARQHEEDVQAFQRSYRIGRMEDLIDDLFERLEERESERLSAEGVMLREGDGRFVLRRGDHEFEVRPRDDMTIAVDGRILRPDPEFPVLTDDLYDEVLARVNAWVDPSRTGPKRLGT